MTVDLALLVKRIRRRPLWEPGRHTRLVQFDRDHVERILPHRDPFLLVDAISAVDLDQKAARGHGKISSEDPVLAGHFPHYPVYPGTLQLEMMGQLGACLIHFVRDSTHEIAPDVEPADVRALRIHHALFQNAVLPGAELIILAKLLAADDYTATVASQLLTAANNGVAAPTICALAVMEGYLVNG